VCIKHCFCLEKLLLRILKVSCNEIMSIGFMHACQNVVGLGNQGTSHSIFPHIDIPREGVLIVGNWGNACHGTAAVQDTYTQWRHNVPSITQSLNSKWEVPEINSMFSYNYVSVTLLCRWIPEHLFTMTTGGQRVMWCGYWPISRQDGDVMPSSSHGKMCHEIHL